MEKGCPGKRVIRPVESTEASFKKKLTPLPELTAHTLVLIVSV